MLKRKAFSIRTVNVLLLILTIILSGIVLYSSYRLASSFSNMREATEKLITFEGATHNLMAASDYLTERAQRFTIEGDVTFMDEYFTEAFETNRREKAVETMNGYPDAHEAYLYLQTAMNSSLGLMYREYYAMRLVVEAKGYTDFPDTLRRVSLSEEDWALSPAEKMRKATKMVLDEEYYVQKNSIRDNMEKSLEKIEELIHNIEEEEQKTLDKDATIVMITIILQVCTIGFMVVSTYYLGMKPVMDAADRIKAGKPLKEIGSEEFKYLAGAYNKMYSRYKHNVEDLNYKASHDELTGVYNRTGYDLLLENLDFKTTCMLMFDIDNFKTVNDTHGHEVGDRVLKKMAGALKRAFRGDDHICRIGGDEFVVFMVNSAVIKKEQLRMKIERINKALADTEDGLPAVSVSVGISFGKDSKDVATMFEKSDEAMYESKKNGKKTMTFYDEAV